MSESTAAKATIPHWHDWRPPDSRNSAVAVVREAGAYLGLQPSGHLEQTLAELI